MKFFARRLNFDGVIPNIHQNMRFIQHVATPRTLLERSLNVTQGKIPKSVTLSPVRMLDGCQRQVVAPNVIYRFSQYRITLPVKRLVVSAVDR